METFLKETVQIISAYLVDEDRKSSGHVESGGKNKHMEGAVMANTDKNLSEVKAAPPGGLGGDRLWRRWETWRP